MYKFTIAANSKYIDPRSYTYSASISTTAAQAEKTVIKLNNEPGNIANGVVWHVQSITEIR